MKEKVEVRGLTRTYSKVFDIIFTYGPEIRAQVQWEEDVRLSVDMLVSPFVRMIFATFQGEEMR